MRKSIGLKTQAALARLKESKQASLGQRNRNIRDEIE